MSAGKVLFCEAAQHGSRRDDKQIHLSAEDAYKLLKNALEIYQKGT